MNFTLQEIIKNGNLKFVNINNQQLLVFESGVVYKVKSDGSIKLIDNIQYSCGYNRIRCGNKHYLRHRIIAYAFLSLDITDTNKMIDHIDGNRINNKLCNLRIVSPQQNQWNRTHAKGWCWDKDRQKFKSNIKVNGKSKHLGHFTNENDARQAYLNAKLLYHHIL